MCLINPYKMTKPQEKKECVFWFIETKSDIQTKRNYRTKYGKSTITSFNLFMAQEIFGYRDSVRYREKWATKNI